MTDIKQIKNNDVQQDNNLFIKFLSIFASSTKLGDLNGKWSAMYKVVMSLLIVCIPTGLGWAVWVTDGIYQSNNYIKTSNLYDNTNRIEILEKNDIKRQQLEKRITELEFQFKSLNRQIISLDKTNTEEHTKISTQLEAIHSLLEYIKHNK